MKRAILLFLVGLIVPTAVSAATGAVRCTLHHFVRNSGTEFRGSGFVFNNADLNNEVTLERLTIRDLFGDVVHDSGPAIGVPHPLVSDLDPDLDITVVPPGATFFITTRNIFTVNPLPGPDGNQRGFTMSGVVEFSKAGNPDLFLVHAIPRTRERVLIGGVFRARAEINRHDSECIRLNLLRRGK